MTESKVKSKEKWFTPADVAAQFHVSPITVRNWANSGKLKTTITPGGHRRFSAQSVDEFAMARNIKFDGKAQEKLTILIVDDDSEVAELLAALIGLHTPNASYLFAVDGFEAGFLTNNHKPDIIFMDIHMPGMSGSTACKLIRQNSATKHIPVIGITGYASSAERDKMMSAGTLCILRKPFDLKQLYPAIDNAIRSN